MPQRVHKEIRILPAIKTETHLFQVGWQMFRADLMPRSHDAALEKREGRFDGVSVNVPVNVDMAFVSNGFVLFDVIGSPHRIGISGPLIGHDHIDIFAHVFSNKRRQSCALSILGMEESEIATTLAYAQNDFFLRSAPSNASPALFSANVSFVQFDGAIQHRSIGFFHRGADSMAEIPRGFVADPKGALDLICAHSFPCFAEQEHGHEPRFQREMSVMKDGLSEHAELVPALDTLELFLRGNLEHTLALAADTFDTVRPAQFLEQRPALFVGREHLSEVGESHG